MGPFFCRATIGIMASKMDLANIRNLLIVLPSWVGDCVMATPLLRAIRNDDRFRGARIVGYMRSTLREILDGANLLDEIVEGQPRGLLGPIVEGRRMGSMGFDAVILLPNSFRFGLTAYISRIPIRIGYGRDGRSWMLTKATDCPRAGGWKEPMPAVEYYLRLGAALGVGADRCDDQRLQIGCTKAQEEAGRLILKSSGIADGESFAILNPGGNRADKRWPVVRFAQAGDFLANRFGLRILVNGSPGERAVVQSVCEGISGTSNAVNLVDHGITLGSLKCLCLRGRIIVTNDTGTRHIAIGSAYEGLRKGSECIRVVTLFGPTEPAWTTLDYPFETEISTGGGPIDGISVGEVCAACEGLLK